MEYIFLLVYTLISIFIGFLVALLWLIKSKYQRSTRWISVLFYLPLSVFTNSLFLMFTSIILDNNVLKNTFYKFDINSFLKGFWELTVVFGSASGITTVIVFILAYFIRRK